jgi:hypothetical protein
LAAEQSKAPAAASQQSPRSQRTAAAGNNAATASGHSQPPVSAGRQHGVGGAPLPLFRQPPIQGVFINQFDKCFKFFIYFFLINGKILEPVKMRQHTDVSALLSIDFFSWDFNNGEKKLMLTPKKF